MSSHKRSQECVIHIRGSLEHNRPDSGKFKKKKRKKEAVVESISHTENIQFRDFFVDKCDNYHCLGVPEVDNKCKFCLTVHRHPATREAQHSLKDNT